MLPPQILASEVYGWAIKESNLFLPFRLVRVYLNIVFTRFYLQMNIDKILQIFHEIYITFASEAEVFWPKVIGAISILILGTIVSYGIYRLIIYLFWKFSILELIEKLWDGFEEKTTQMVDKNPDDNAEKREEKEEKVSKVRYDRITAKAISYYIFLLFFRSAVVVIGITEVEQFMQDLIAYLPSLFVGILIGFFGLRFANSVHDIVYQALELTKDRTSKIIATGAKIIILFFTLMIMLNYIKIVDQFIINALFIGFITTLTISLGLAFGMGGRDIAKEILESFRK